MLLWNDRSINEVRKVMGRLINSSFAFHAEYPEQSGVTEGRIETRAKRMLPIAIFLTNDSDDSPFVGFTHDLSVEGIGVLSTRQIPLGELVLVLDDHPEKAVLRASCVHSDRIGFGCFRSGIRIEEVLKGQTVLPLKQYVEYLESL